MALHLKGYAKGYLKLKGRMPNWNEYITAMRTKFGSLAYEDPMVKIKKLKQMGSLKNYLREFDVLLDRAQLSESQAL